MLSLWLPWELPGMNELIDWRAVRCKSGNKTRAVATEPKYGPNKYSVMKAKWENSIGLYARSRGFSVPAGCWSFTYLFVVETRRKDPSNIAAGAVKLIEDALCKAGLMDGDGWATVQDLHYYFRKDTPSGVLMAANDGTVPLAQMLEQWSLMHGKRK